MRCIKNKIEHNGSGTVTLCPDEPEDMVLNPSFSVSAPRSHLIYNSLYLVARLQPDPTRRYSSRQRNSSSYHSSGYRVHELGARSSQPCNSREESRLRPAELSAPCIRTNYQRNTAHENRTIPYPRSRVESQLYVRERGWRRWRGCRVGQYCN